MSTVLLAIVFVGSLSGVLFIIIRHLSAVSSLDPHELTHIRHEQLKAEILLARFERLIVRPVQQLARFIATGTQQFSRVFERLFHHLKTLEHYYEKVTLERQRTASNAAAVAETSESLITAAKDFFAKKMYEDAERKYIAAIGLDPKCIAAYEGLGELYYEKKEYDAARETYAHIVKLNERNAEAHARLGSIASASGNLEEAEKDFAKAAELAGDLVSSHIDLGVVHEALGKQEEALANFLKARELEPKNPRVLDVLLDTAIILRKRALAEEVLATLAEVNPENQKLEELRARVTAMPEEEIAKPKKKKVAGL